MSRNTDCHGHDTAKQHVLHESTVSMHRWKSSQKFVH